MKNLYKFDYFFLFIIVLYGGSAIPYTSSLFIPAGGLFFTLLPWSLCVYFIFVKKVNFININLIKFIFFYLLWIVFQYIKFKHFYIGFLVFFGNILISYAIISVYKTLIFKYFSDIISFLCKVSIIGWILRQIIPDIFLKFMKLTSVYDLSNNSCTISANNLFYSLTSDNYFDGGYNLYRNSGFSWEPGRFAIMIIFGIFCNLLYNNFELFKNRSLYYMVIALLTTQSTTGYFAFFIIIIYYVVTKVNNILFKYFIVLLILSGTMFLPFLGDKISALWFDDANIEGIIKNSVYNESINNDEIKTVPQRFDALVFDLLNIMDSPLIGYGVDWGNSFVSIHISNNISLPGGFLGCFARYGIFFGIFLYSLLFVSSKYLKYKYKTNLLFLLFGIFLACSVSYNIWDVPYFMVIYLNGYFEKI